MVIPVIARKPAPANRETDVPVNVTLNWRAGREAAEHNVFLGTDQQMVIDGTASVETVSNTNYGPLSLDLETTYYWRVDEVNNAQSTTLWPGETWNFKTRDYIVVDDFESYNDIPAGENGSNLIYETWTDGYANPSTNGSTIGYVSGSSLETDNVHGGRQAVPIAYDNSTAPSSEVTVNTINLPIGQDWSIGSPQILILWFYGDPGNAPTEQMYVKINNIKVSYDGDIAGTTWQQWNIDLMSLAVNLNNITKLSIGFDKTGSTGGSGTVLIDDIRLYKTAPAE